MCENMRAGDVSPSTKDVTRLCLNPDESSEDGDSEGRQKVPFFGAEGGFGRGIPTQHCPLFSALVVQDGVRNQPLVLDEQNLQIAQNGVEMNPEEPQSALNTSLHPDQDEDSKSDYDENGRQRICFNTLHICQSVAIGGTSTESSQSYYATLTTNSSQSLNATFPPESSYLTQSLTRCPFISATKEKHENISHNHSCTPPVQDEDYFIQGITSYPSTPQNSMESLKCEPSFNKLSDVKTQATPTRTLSIHTKVCSPVQQRRTKAELNSKPTPTQYSSFKDIVQRSCLTARTPAEKISHAEHNLSGQCPLENCLLIDSPKTYNQTVNTQAEANPTIRNRTDTNQLHSETGSCAIHDCVASMSIIQIMNNKCPSRFGKSADEAELSADEHCESSASDCEPPQTNESCNANSSRTPRSSSFLYPRLCHLLEEECECSNIAPEGGIEDTEYENIPPSFNAVPIDSDLSFGVISDIDNEASGSEGSGLRNRYVPDRGGFTCDTGHDSNLLDDLNLTPLGSNAEFGYPALNLRDLFKLINDTGNDSIFGLESSSVHSNSSRFPGRANSHFRRWIYGLWEESVNRNVSAGMEEAGETTAEGSDVEVQGRARRRINFGSLPVIQRGGVSSDERGRVRRRINFGTLPVPQRGGVSSDDDQYPLQRLSDSVGTDKVGIKESKAVAYSDLYFSISGLRRIAITLVGRFFVDTVM